jgi:hypothetical protein
MIARWSVRLKAILYKLRKKTAFLIYPIDYQNSLPALRGGLFFIPFLNFESGEYSVHLNLLRDSEIHF